MNRAEEFPDSEQSDSDFCPEKEAQSEVSEEASSEESEDSTENAKEKAAKGRKKAQPKKTRKRPRHTTPGGESDSDSDDEGSSSAPSARRRATRQNDESSNSNGKAALEKDELRSDEEDKSRTEALWADFMSDVKGKPAPKVTKTETAKPKASTSAESSTVSSTNTITKATNGESQVPAEKKMILLKEESPKQVKVTEVLDFAGEEVRVEKLINADSIKENKLAPAGPVFKRAAPLASGSGGARPGTGLGSLLNQIGKKKKLSVLEKSKMDWNSFKKDEGIEEELQTFNKGKDGFLERQDFLQRTDLRQFEIEKNLRQSRRNN